MFKAHRTERVGEDAGAALSDQQMRFTKTRFPVDRYLVGSSKKIDMVNLIDDDIWNPEPALRPEDEIILRKLHDMLQSTADDLKLLSGELSKHHEPGVRMKTLPTPLDEDFNDKIHIEEVVNAKFHGDKVINSSQLSPIKTSCNKNGSKKVNNKKKQVSAGVQVTSIPFINRFPKNKNLQISSTRVIHIDEQPDINKASEKHVGKNISNQIKRVPTVSYNEYSYKYTEPTFKVASRKPLQVQEMPRINIRSELRQQKVVQLDILPESSVLQNQQPFQHNALVIEMQHESLEDNKSNTIKFDNKQYVTMLPKSKPTLRKVSTMSTHESSDSNNISSNSPQKIHEQDDQSMLTSRTEKLEHKYLKERVKCITNIKDTKRSHAHFDAWKKKLNSIYGRSLNSNAFEIKKKKTSPKLSSTKPFRKAVTRETEANIKQRTKGINNEFKKGLNNAEYIPYSKLTLGGVSVSEVERELSALPNINNVPLSPILDKILSSRESSFNNDNFKINGENKNPKILSTSDENLLQEVLDVENKITSTLSTKGKNINKTSDKILSDQTETLKESDSYADDFEDEKSEASGNSVKSHSDSYHPSSSLQSENSFRGNTSDHNNTLEQLDERKRGNKYFQKDDLKKSPNLSFKNSVDIFEFVHSVDTQDTGTQSNSCSKITPKETQTSPRNDISIHNDLWPSIDPKGEVKKMFKLEKDFIKKLIIDEYGDLLEKSLNKPSTSSRIENDSSWKNMTALQKNTQTSPAHLKSVMTSPTRTKTRTTSPLALSLTVNQQTSPIIVVSNEALNLEIENEDDLGISVNLSSPRFNLRLPQTSREVLSNIETFHSQNKSNQISKSENIRRSFLSSTSSADAEYSSSDISSMGEINKKFKKLRKSKILSYSDLSSSSSISRYTSDPSGAFLPLRSEGEASVKQKNLKKNNKQCKSEGEVSLGQLR